MQVLFIMFFELSVKIGVCDLDLITRRDILNWGLINWLIEHSLTSPPTQYRLYGRQFLQVKRYNQQYQSTEGTYSTQITQNYNKQTYKQKTQQIP